MVLCFYDINASKHVLVLIIPIASQKSLPWSINLITFWIIIFLNGELAPDCDSCCAAELWGGRDFGLNDTQNISAKHTFIT